mgnify:CR=1 FL=1
MTFQIKKHKFLVLALAVSAVALSGCGRNLYEETTITQSKMQLEETKFVEQIDASEFNDGYARALSDYYSRSGDGVIEVSVLYDPQSRHNTAMNASHEASRISGLMRSNGAHNVETNILPVNGAGEKPQIMTTFASYELSGPKDCGAMPGMENRNIDLDPDYEMGCSFQTIMARQISRPTDMKGQELGGNADGRRSANITNTYRTGVPNQPLDGESASDN